LFSRSASNPFNSYTILHVLYCSGDAHSGNVTREYNDLHGVPVMQRGYTNTRAALDWLHANLRDRELTDLVVSGCSAGSIGVQTWAATIFKEFKAQRRAFLADSFAGVFPHNSQGATISGYGMCELELIPPSLRARCRDGNITLQDYMEATLIAYPSIPFAFLNSKDDMTQRTYYSAIAATFGDQVWLSGSEYYQELNGVWERYAQHGNFINYMVTGTQHCYTNSDLLFSADTASKHGKGKGGQPLLSEWINHLPLRDGDSISTACDGPLADPQADGTGVKYCDVALADRTINTTALLHADAA